MLRKKLKSFIINKYDSKKIRICYSKSERFRKISWHSRVTKIHKIMEKSSENREGEPSLLQEIKDKRENLEKDNFISVDLNLSDIEREVLSRVKIEKELEQFNYYGPLADDLEIKLEDKFKEMGRNSENDISIISRKVAELAREMVSGFDEEAAWVMVRVSLPNDEFQTPRWHPDGSYYYDNEGRRAPAYKLVATLKGHQTLFAEKIDAEKFGKTLTGEDTIETRKELAKLVKPINIVKDGQGVVYLVGHKDAVIHSEPNITDSRIFIAVLPGSGKQLKEWKGDK